MVVKFRRPLFINSRLFYVRMVKYSSSGGRSNTIASKTLVYSVYWDVPHYIYKVISYEIVVYCYFPPTNNKTP